MANMRLSNQIIESSHEISSRPKLSNFQFTSSHGIPTVPEVSKINLLKLRSFKSDQFSPNITNFNEKFYESYPG